jgi:hypothetical protein
VPVKARLAGLRDLFERALRARGSENRRALVARLLVAASAEEVCTVGLALHAEKGNDDRLLLTIELLSSAKNDGLEALESLLRDYRPELTAFVPLIASAPWLTTDQRVQLLQRIARYSFHDTDLRDRLLEVLEWLDEEQADRVRPTLQLG